MDFEELHREESGRILATLIGLLGDFDLAEEMLQEAYSVALQKWPTAGTPANPRAWLISTARHKAIDRLRRDQRFERKSEEIAKTAEIAARPEGDREEEMFADDRLRLIFTCCHPSLPLEARVALTLRTVCGITTEEISRAFLVPLATMAQRLVRAKGKIREAGIPYRVPSPEELRDRLDGVLLVVYLIFNEGYLASSGDALIRRELCTEAIRLGRVLCSLLPRQAEAWFCWRNRTGICGTGNRFRRGRSLWNRRCALAPTACMHCKLRSQRCMPMRRGPKTRTGRRLRPCMTSS